MDKKAILFFIVLTAIVTLVFTYGLTKKDTTTREIAILVNGQPIYVDEIDDEFATLTPEQNESVQLVDVFDFLIEKKLLLQEAKKENIAVTQGEIDRLFTFEAQELMLNQGITKASFMKRLGEQAVINKLLAGKDSNERILYANRLKRDADIIILYTP